MQTVFCVQTKEIHPGQRSFDPSILGFEQDCPAGCDTYCHRPPEQHVQREALDFIENARSNMVGPNQGPRFIPNMDQTPFFFDMPFGRTLSASGERTVNGHTLSSSTLQVTVSLTMAVSGMLLKPLFVFFKGKPGARMETQEIPTVPQDNFYACQDCAWMGERRVMQLWVLHLILTPYVEEA